MDRHYPSYFVQKSGAMCIEITKYVSVFVTLDQSVRVINKLKSIAIAVNRDASKSAVIHPLGKALQLTTGTDIHFVDQSRNQCDKLCKFSNKGITFTSENSPIVYKLDEAACCLSQDFYTDLSNSVDFTLAVFYEGCHWGNEFIDSAANILTDINYWVTSDGTKYWRFLDYKIIQFSNGKVTVLKLDPNTSKVVLRISVCGTPVARVKLDTKLLHCTAMCAHGKNHMFIKNGPRRVYFNGKEVHVRMEGQTAGLDATGDIFLN